MRSTRPVKALRWSLILKLAKKAERCQTNEACQQDQRRLRFRSRHNLDTVYGGPLRHQGTARQSVERKRRPRKSVEDDVISGWRVDPLVGIGSAGDLNKRSVERRIVLCKDGSRTNRE